MASNFVQSAVAKIKSVAQGLGKVYNAYATNSTVQKIGQWENQKVVQPFYNAVTNIPRIQLPASFLAPTQTKSPILNKVSSLGSGLVRGALEGPLNIPRDTAVGFARLNRESIAPLIDKRPVSLQNVAAGVSNLAEAGLNLSTLGIGKSLIKEGGKQLLKTGIKQAVKEGAISGAGYGAAFGGASGIGNQYNKPFDWKEVASSTAGGALLGGVLGGAISSVGALKGLIFPSKGASKVEAQLRRADGEWVKGTQPVKPDGMTQAAWEFQLAFNAKYDRSPYKPVYPSDLVAATKYEAESRAGMTVRDISKPKIPGSIPENVSQQPLSVKGVGEVTKPSSQISPEISGKLKAQPINQEIVPKMKGVGGNEVSVPSTPLQSASGTQGPVVSSSKIITQKYAENINLNRLGLTPKEKTVLRTSIDSIKPVLEKVKGKTLSHQEVIQAAKKSDILTKVTTRDETMAAEAAVLKARQRLVELDKDITRLAGKGSVQQLKAKMTDLVESLKVVSGSAADAGRKLESFSIGAEDQSVRTLLLKEIGKTEKDTAKIVEEAAKVDWNNANSLTAFYRKFIKPSTMEVLDEYRYNNMLSNPRTHIRNAFSNLVQTVFTRPATLVAQGKPIEAAKYYTGALKSFPKAVSSFVESFKGTKAIEKPDIAHIGTGKLPKIMTIPSRAMEAGDKFFSALIEGGELARGATPEQAAKTAEYSLFRQGLFPEGQGKLLNAIDSVTQWTYKAPKAVRWFVPFIRTPMNFAKQWIEYSPTGLATLPGSTMKREQLGKVIVGSAVAAIGAKFALEGNTTWEAPIDPKQKELFYASGRKPFSVRLGDKWVSMMYAGPFAMAFAIPAAVKYYNDESKTALTDTQMQKLGKIVASGARFLSGQTFLENIGNFVKFASGDADYSLPSNLAFTAGQVIPMEGLIRWISTMVDPIYRKGTSFKEGVMKNLPFISKTLPAYTTPEGLPSTRERVNLVTPYDISTNQPSYEPQLEQRTNKLQQNAVENNIKKEIETSQGGTKVAGNKIFYWDAESANTKSVDMAPITEPSLTGDTVIDKKLISGYKSSLNTRMNNILDAYKAGAIPFELTKAEVNKLQTLYDNITASTKKPKTFTVKKVSTPKIKGIKAPKIKNMTQLLKASGKLRVKKYNFTKKI